MDVFYSHIKLVLICLIFKFSLTYGQDVCAKKGPCSCEFPNGTGIDLSPTVKSDFYKAQMFVEQNNTFKKPEYKLSIYYFHPCYDALLNPTFNNSIIDTCKNRSLSLCRHMNTMTLIDGTTNNYTLDQGEYDYLGDVNAIKFSSDGSAIIYENRPSKTTVLLVCAQTDSVLQVLSLDDPRELSAHANESAVLAFYSRDACFKQLEIISTRSAGSTLLIIFFSFVVFYLVLGICTKKFLMGATGIEVIPNLTFWSDLPGLVKDGWEFTVSGFKLTPRGPAPAATSPDRNSYDSI